MKKITHIQAAFLRSLLICLLGLFLVAGNTPCFAQENTADAAPAEAASVVVPAGTRLFVTMDSELDSRKIGTGHRFTVTLDTNLVVDGTTVATKGTRLYGQTTNAKKGGMLAGKSEIDLQLSDFLINDTPHPIVTSGVKAITDNKAGNTVKNTAVGAGVGGLAGGSKGAAIGAAAGLGLSALGGGKSINIPSGTLLEFTLEAPLTYKS